MRSPSLAVPALVLLAAAAHARGPEGACATEVDGARHILALHRYWREAGVVGIAGAAQDRDVDQVALLEDRGDMVIRRNPFDLDGASLRLSPNAAGGYDTARLAFGLEEPGTLLGLGDDDVRSVDLPFPFPFYGRTHARVFVHSDGHLTFDRSDTASTERGLARFLSGPPRVAPFFADLDPSRGGSVTALVLPDRAVFVWSDVPGGGQINRNTFEVTLHAGGTLDMVYGAALEAREAIVGVSPGGTLDVTPADLSGAQPSGSAGALAERFSETERLDIVAVTHRFYATHPDLFEQVVIYTTRPLNPVGGTLAFELNLREDIQGIGAETRDDSADWGSAGSLASVVFMDSIDPYLEVDGFEILAHEVGHRWLARLRFRDATGASSPALLGRGRVHWSFFMDTDASVMEGNDIEDRGGGRFETVDFALGYSALDQYVMGLRGASEVPPFFYVEAPDNFRPNRPYALSSAPEAGVSFTGTRRDVRIEDVIAAMGPRVPDAGHAPHRLRQAFILVADPTASATETRLRAVARIRSHFESYYRDATGGRGVVDSTLP